MKRGKTIQPDGYDRNRSKNVGDLDFTLGYEESKKQADSRHKKNQHCLVIDWMG